MLGERSQHYTGNYNYRSADSCIATFDIYASTTGVPRIITQIIARVGPLCVFCQLNYQLQDQLNYAYVYIINHHNNRKFQSYAKQNTNRATSGQSVSFQYIKRCDGAMEQTGNKKDARPSNSNVIIQDVVVELYCTKIEATMAIIIIVIQSTSL